METPTLSRLSNQTYIATRLDDIIHSHLGISSENELDEIDKKLGHTKPAHYRVLLAHHNSNFPLGDFISILSEDISRKIYERGKELCKEKFKNFNERKTRLTPEILEELWLEVSSLFANKTFEVYDNVYVVHDRKVHDFTIPGLAFAITKGPITFDTSLGKLGDSEVVRDILKDDLNKTDDLVDFYRRARNDFFKHWRENYGLFNGVKNKILEE